MAFTPHPTRRHLRMRKHSDGVLNSIAKSGSLSAAAAKAVLSERAADRVKAKKHQNILASFLED